MIGDDAFGLEENQTQSTVAGIVNAKRQQYKFLRTDKKVKAFQSWFQAQVDENLLTVDSRTGKPWTAKYVESAWKKGMLRSYLDARKSLSIEDPKFISGSQSEFLRRAFGAPEAVSKLELLGTRAFEGMKGVTAEMSKNISRVLVDGLARGQNPRQIAKDLVKQVGIGKNRALRIARTEIIHAHAEGQLDALEELGIDEIEAMVEWATAGDARVCQRCEVLEGEVFSIEDARGMIPLHPNCRCAWIPANVGE